MCADEEHGSGFDKDSRAVGASPCARSAKLLVRLFVNFAAIHLAKSTEGARPAIWVWPLFVHLAPEHEPPRLWLGINYPFEQGAVSAHVV